MPVLARLHPTLMRLARISLLAQAIFYTAAGINHFWHPNFYVRIMPDHYSDPAALVKLSGLAEVLGGVGLLQPKTRRLSGVGIAIMLIVFLDVHQFMLRHADRFPEVPRSILVARIPLQFVLIAWALSAARKDEQARALPQP